MNINKENKKIWNDEIGKVPQIDEMTQEEKQFVLDEYQEFMNDNVLKPIGVDYYDLLRRGLAIPAKEVSIRTH